MKKLIMALVVSFVASFGLNVEAATYVVKSGDTPSGVSKKLNIKTVEVMKIAGITDARKLRVGTRIDTDKLTSVSKSEKSNVAVARKVTASSEFAVSNLSSSATMKAAPASSENFAASSTVVATDVADKTEQNLQKAQEKGMLASADKSLIPETGKTAPVDESGSHKFIEASVTAGGWFAPKTSGVYGLLEGIQWFGNANGDRNLGIGAVLQLDKGWGESGTSWGFVAPGIEGGYWKNLDDKHYVLVKPRISWRINQKNQWHDKPDSGVMVGGYAEVSRVFTPRDLGIIAADGNYFKNDSYAAIRAYWEHVVSNDWKVKAGVGPAMHWQKDQSSMGISPALIAKYRDSISVGITADTSKGGTFYGGFVTYEFNSDRHDPLNRSK